MTKLRVTNVTNESKTKFGTEEGTCGAKKLKIGL